MNKNILVIAAHPDDEILGCGGTIMKHSMEGDKVNILIAAEGITSRPQEKNKEDLKKELDNLIESAKCASNILNANDIDFLHLPDNRLDSMDRLVLTQLIEKKIKELKPEVVYTHHCGDVNIDHRRLYEATITACRPLPENCVKQLLTYEVSSSTDWQPPGSYKMFEPNIFNNIERYLSYKIEALEAYTSEMRDWPHSRSIKAVKHLARLRGSQVGLEAAEAFFLLREIK